MYFSSSSVSLRLTVQIKDKKKKIIKGYISLKSCNFKGIVLLMLIVLFEKILLLNRMLIIIKGIFFIQLQNKAFISFKHDLQ